MSDGPRRSVRAERMSEDGIKREIVENPGGWSGIVQRRASKAEIEVDERKTAGICGSKHRDETRIHKWKLPSPA